MPFNSMPLAKQIDYQAAAVVVNITDTSSWLPKPVHWAPSAASHAAWDAHHWLPDIDVSGFAIQVLALCLRPRHADQA